MSCIYMSKNERFELIITSVATTLSDATLEGHRIIGDSIREFPSAGRLVRLPTSRTFIMGEGIPYVSFPRKVRQRGGFHT